VAVVGKGLTFDSGGYNLKAGPGSMVGEGERDDVE
jgi:leucyl aminopeptidase